MEQAENGQVVLVTKGEPITREMVQKLMEGTNLNFGNRCHRCGRHLEGGLCSCQVTG